ncbi:MAG: PBP1A family penicillin-binding protein [Polyangiaceae bacterium]|nr:PBP1A family penicillin-binding protein [Polyangiaceae bacterium]
MKFAWTSTTKRVLFFGATLLLLGSVVASIVLYLTIRDYTKDLPDVSSLETEYAPRQVTRILARDGSLLEKIYTERRTVVPLERIPDHVKLAFLAAEDAHFFEHQGLNPLGLARALVKNLVAGRVRQGGSTITQQVVKNVLLDQERSYRRKVRETILAYRIEKFLSKEQILGMYMNHIYLGHGRYGVQEAGRHLFGKNVEELSIAEGALIAGIVASPERYTPRRHLEKALVRRAYVLGQMKKKDFLDEALYEKAMEEPVRISPSPESESDIAPEIVAPVKKVLEALGGEHAKKGGFTVTTTLEPRLQVAARAALRAGLDAYPRRQKLKPPYTLKKRRLWGKPFTGNVRQHGIYVGQVVDLDDGAQTIDLRVGSVMGRVSLAKERRYNPSRLLPSHFVTEGAALRVRVVDDPKTATVDHPVRLALELGPQAALVALEVKTGDIVASVGNYEALPGALDRTSQSRRQPGSTFKPFVYSYALKGGQYNPATVFEFPWSQRARSAWFEQEEERQKLFPASDALSLPAKERIRLRQGVAKSDNRVAQAVIHGVGASNVVSWAHSLGVESELGADESLALGAYEVTPLEMAEAYSVFARGGRRLKARRILRIDSGAGPLPLVEREAEEQVMDPGVAFLMTSLLESVIQEGTGRRARVLKRPLAGKTGTTNRSRDAWFVGYSTDYVCAVWVGYDDTLPLGWGEAGATAALPIWIDFMKAAHEGRPRVSFPQPADVESFQIDPRTGGLAAYGQDETIPELFLRQFPPQEIAVELEPTEKPKEAIAPAPA